MKALVKTKKGVGHIKLLDRPEPQASAGQVVIRVALAGLCGTDLHIVADEFPHWPPVTLGHEFVGTVEVVGANVDALLQGVRVVCEPHAGTCGTCDLCRRGVGELCAAKRSPGWGIDGAFAAKIAVPAHLLHPVDDRLPNEVAVLAEPMAVAVSAISRCGIEPGDTVLVVGPGPIGILSAMAADALGAGQVIVAGRHPGARLEHAEAVGFRTADSAADALAQVNHLTNGRGADLVVEATGEESAVHVAIESVRRRGRIAAVGIGSLPNVTFPWNLAIGRSVELTFCTSSSHTAWPGALEVLLRQRDRLAEMATIYPLGEWRAAIEAATARAVTKVVFDPSESGR